MISPWWKNFFYNMATVQFDHRLGAWALAFLVPLLWLRLRRAAGAVDSRARLDGEPALAAAASRSGLLLGLLAVQITLGISTLLTGVAVPLAVAHQAMAVIVFAAALAVSHALSAAPAQPAATGSVQPLLPDGSTPC